jgi:hypothetical protein
MDGVGIGFIEAPKTWHLVEMKTHSAKSFRSVVTHGVKKAKPDHWCQMQTYMHLSDGLTRAFYLAVNKDTDELHMEIVEANPEAARRYVDRARLILDNVPPPRISNTPGFWKCKFCPVRTVCFQGEAPSRTCRSCTHVRCSPVEKTDRWSCIKFHMPISTAIQKSGCAQWEENECIRQK